MNRLSIPSKTFLLGEYAILEGCPALLLGHGPRFEAQLESAGPSASPFHPKSPAGLWLESHPFPGKISFRDPHEGRGGFGASGAEFVAAFRTTEMETEPEAFAWKAWKASRDFPGSGADVLTQAFGLGVPGDFLLRVDLETRSLRQVSKNAGLTLSLFHTGRKLPTHEHLKEKRKLPLSELSAMVKEGVDGLEKGDGPAFAYALSSYGDCLARFGLLAPHSESALETLPLERVLAAKGCGAMGADVLLVAHHGADLAAWARANSLAPSGNFPV
ncbi:MAG TPA: hypothetical protein VIH99_08275 [Bdellovibrionota bacterium]